MNSTPNIPNGLKSTSPLNYALLNTLSHLNVSPLKLYSSLNLNVSLKHL